MKTMNRKLGKSGIEVSPLGFGCWAIGGYFTLWGKPDGWGDVDDNESIRAIHRAMELGVNFFDTADAYGTGHSEEVLGEALTGMRHKAVIATKGGYLHDAEAKNLYGEDTSPEYIRKAVEASLRRLKTDYIDLYQIHNWTMPSENVEPLFNELDKMVEEGKIRAYGWSTGDVGNVRLFIEKTRGSAIQHPANLLIYNQEVIDLCEKNQLAGINNAPLAMGLLSGKFGEKTFLPGEDVRGAGHEWVPYFHEGRPKKEFLEKLEAVKEILRSNGRTLAQGALAWLWAKSESNIPIPGFKNIKQVEENAGAIQFGPLTDSQMKEIDTLLGR
jgi:aryl-alcohol dehydrogenase-like predicted oxidoreductase